MIYRNRMKNTALYETVKKETFLQLDKPFYFLTVNRMGINSKCNKINSSDLDCKGTKLDLFLKFGVKNGIKGMRGFIIKNLFKE